MSLKKLQYTVIKIPDERFSHGNNMVHPLDISHCLEVSNTLRSSLAYYNEIYGSSIPPQPKLPFLSH